MNTYSGSDIFEDTQENIPRQVTNYSQSAPIPSKIQKSSFFPRAIKLISSWDDLSKHPHQVFLNNVVPLITNPEKKDSPRIYVYTLPKSEKQHRQAIEKENVSEEFVRRFNANRGNEHYLSQAREMLEKTCLLAGIVPSDQEIDIPSARKNFAILATLDNRAIKLAALDNLQKVLEKDDLTPESAFDLVPLAIYLMQQMDAELIQTQNVDIQVKICKVYGVVAELIQRQYAKGHLGGIRQELKKQLIETAQKLDNLNTTSGTHLHFSVEFALEGVKRLHDDKKELFEIIENVYHILLTASSIFAQDMEPAQANFEQALQGLRLPLMHSWYDGAMICNEIAKGAYENLEQLMVLQAFVKKEYKGYDWKFLYNAMNIFGDIAVKSSKKSIAEAALKGTEALSNEFAGLIHYVNIKDFNPKIDLKPVIHLSLPRRKSINKILQNQAAYQLIRIASDATEQSVRCKAKLTLLECLKNTSNEKLKINIRKAVPRSKKEQQDWVNEKNAFIWIPPIEKLSLQPLTKPQKIFYDSLGSEEKIQLARSESSPTDSSLDILPEAIAVMLSPSKMLDRLSSCLGANSDVIKENLKDNLSTFIPNERGILVNKKSMKIISDLVEKLNIIKLDFRNSHIATDAFPYLFKLLEKGIVIQLYIGQKLTETGARLLANFMEDHPEINIDLCTHANHSMIGDILLERGNPEEAAKHFDRGILRANSSKTKSKLHFKMGQALDKKGETRKSIHHYQKALDHDPKFHKAAEELAYVFNQIGSMEEAKIWKHKAQLLAPPDPQTNNL